MDDKARLRQQGRQKLEAFRKKKQGGGKKNGPSQVPIHVDKFSETADEGESSALQKSSSSGSRMAEEIHIEAHTELSSESSLPVQEPNQDPPRGDNRLQPQSTSQEMGSMLGELAELRAQVHHATSRAEAAERRNLEIQQELKRMEGHGQAHSLPSPSKSATRLMELQAEYDDLTRQYQAALARSGELEATNSELMQELKGTKTQAASFIEEKLQLEQELSQMRKKSSDQEAQLAAATRQTESAVNQLRDAEMRCTRLQVKLEAVENDLTISRDTLTREREAANVTVQRSREQAAQWEEQMRAVTTERDELKTMLEQAEDNGRDLQMKVAALRDYASAHAEEMNEVCDKLTAVEEKARHSESRMIEATEREEQLQQELVAVKDYARSLAAELAKSQEGARQEHEVMQSLLSELQQELEVARGQHAVARSEALWVEDTKEMLRIAENKTMALEGELSSTCISLKDTEEKLQGSLAQVATLEEEVSRLRTGWVESESEARAGLEEELKHLQEAYRQLESALGDVAALARQGPQSQGDLAASLNSCEDDQCEGCQPNGLSVGGQQGDLAGEVHVQHDVESSGFTAAGLLELGAAGHQGEALDEDSQPDGTSNRRSQGDKTGGEGGEGPNVAQEGSGKVPLVMESKAKSTLEEIMAQVNLKNAEIQRLTASCQAADGRLAESNVQVCQLTAAVEEYRERLLGSEKDVITLTARLREVLEELERTKSETGGLMDSLSCAQAEALAKDEELTQLASELKTWLGGGADLSHLVTELKQSREDVSSMAAELKELQSTAAHAREQENLIGQLKEDLALKDRVMEEEREVHAAEVTALKGQMESLLHERELSQQLQEQLQAKDHLLVTLQHQMDIIVEEKDKYCNLLEDLKHQLEELKVQWPKCYGTRAEEAAQKLMQYDVLDTLYQTKQAQVVHNTCKTVEQLLVAEAQSSEQLIRVLDELATARSEVDSLTNKLLDVEGLLKEEREAVATLRQQNDVYSSRICDLLRDKEELADQYTKKLVEVETYSVLSGCWYEEKATPDLDTLGCGEGLSAPDGHGVPHCEVEELRQKLESLESLLEEAKVECEDCWVEKASLVAETESVREELVSLQALLDGRAEADPVELSHFKTTLEQQLAVARDEVDTLTQKLSDERETVTALRQHNDGHSARICDLMREKEDLADQYVRKLVEAETYSVLSGCWYDQRPVEEEVNSVEAHAEREVQVLRSEIQSLQELLEAARGAQEAAGTEVSGLRLQVEGLEAHLEAAEVQHAAITTDKALLAAEVSRLQGEEAALLAIKEELQSTLDLLAAAESRVSSLTYEKESLGVEMRSFREEVQSMNSLLEEAEVARKSLMEGKDLLEVEVASLRSTQGELADLKSQVEALQSHLEVARTALAESKVGMASKVEDMLSQNELLRAQLESSTAEMMALAEEKGKLEELVETLKSDTKELSTRVDASESGRLAAVDEKNQLEATLSRLKAHVGQLQEQLEQAEAEQLAANEEKAKLEKDLVSSVSQLQSWQSQCEETGAKHLALIEEKASLEQELLAMRTQVDDWRSQSEVVKGQCSSLSEEKATLEHDLDRVRTEAQAWRAQLEAAEAQCSTLAEERGRLEKELSTLRGLDADASSLKRQVMSMQSLLEGQEGRCLHLSDEKASLLEELEVMRKQIQVTESQLNTVEVEREFLAEEVAKLKGEVQTQKVQATEVTNLSSQVEALQALLEDSEAKCSAAIQEKSQLSADAADLRSQLQMVQAHVNMAESELANMVKDKELTESKLVSLTNLEPKVHELRGQVESLQALLGDREKSHIDDLEQWVEACIVTSQVHSLKSELEEAEWRSSSISDERAQLAREVAALNTHVEVLREKFRASEERCTSLSAMVERLEAEATVRRTVSRDPGTAGKLTGLAAVSGQSLDDDLSLRMSGATTPDCDSYSTDEVTSAAPRRWTRGSEDGGGVLDERVEGTGQIAQLRKQVDDVRQKLRAAVKKGKALEAAKQALERQLHGASEGPASQIPEVGRSTSQGHLGTLAEIQGPAVSMSSDLELHAQLMSAQNMEQEALQKVKAAEVKLAQALKEVAETNEKAEDYKAKLHAAVKKGKAIAKEKTVVEEELQTATKKYEQLVEQLQGALATSMKDAEKQQRQKEEQLAGVQQELSLLQQEALDLQHALRCQQEKSSQLQQSYEDTQRELHESSASHAALRNELEVGKQKLMDEQYRAESIRANLEEVNRQVESLTAEVQQAHEQEQRLSSSMAVLQAEKGFLEGKVQELKMSIEEVGRQAAGQEAKLKDIFEEQLQRRVEELAMWKGRYEEASEQLANAADMSKSMATDKAKLRQARDTLQRLQHDKNTLQQKVEQLEVQVHDLSMANQHLQQEAVSLRRSSAAHEQRSKSSQGGPGEHYDPHEVHSLNHQLTEALSTVATLTAAVSNQEEEKRSLLEKLAEADQRINDLTASISSKEAEVVSLSKQLAEVEARIADLMMAGATHGVMMEDTARPLYPAAAEVEALKSAIVLRDGEISALLAEVEQYRSKAGHGYVGGSTISRPAEGETLVLPGEHMGDLHNGDQQDSSRAGAVEVHLRPDVAAASTAMPASNVPTMDNGPGAVREQTLHLAGLIQVVLDRLQSMLVGYMDVSAVGEDVRKVMGMDSVPELGGLAQGMEKVQKMAEVIVDLYGQEVKAKEAAQTHAAQLSAKCAALEREKQQLQHQDGGRGSSELGSHSPTSSSGATPRIGSAMQEAALQVLTRSTGMASSSLRPVRRERVVEPSEEGGVHHVINMSEATRDMEDDRRGVHLDLTPINSLPYLRHVPPRVRSAFTWVDRMTVYGTRWMILEPLGRVGLMVYLMMMHLLIVWMSTTCHARRIH